MVISNLNFPVRPDGLQLLFYAAGGHDTLNRNSGTCHAGDDKLIGVQFFGDLGVQGQRDRGFGIDRSAQDGFGGDLPVDLQVQGRLPDAFLGQDELDLELSGLL